MDEYDFELDDEAENDEFHRLADIGLDFPFHIVKAE